MTFSTDFIWGAASSAYQIEGAAYADGKGLSVWDMMCRKQGAIYQAQNGEIACDHYHAFKQDVVLMKEIGIRAYRFSLSWPRIIPGGTGEVNPQGIAFYNALINELLENDIIPYITLFHWDYPYDLYRRGSWLNHDSPKWFAEYTKIVVNNFSDRVENWITLNEPQCFIGLGHQTGIHAPGDKLDLAEVLIAGHHALVAHGRSVQVIREYAKRKPSIGYAPVGIIKMPTTDAMEDVERARHATFSVNDSSCWNNTWWMDSVLLGRYPEDGLRLYGDAVPHFSTDEMETISTPIDFLGSNIYNGAYVTADQDGNCKEAQLYNGFAGTAMDWPVTPEALYWGPKFLYERYKKPIFITENGMANTDWPSVDGKVHDPQRIDFLHRYLVQLKRICDEGIPVKGYFQWSLTDNFEWSFGYNKRFGLIYIDYRDQRRILKESAYWYQQIIISNGGCL
ncbi:MAG: beta-glucosidase [Planctomycetes bacterium GWF2_42_9]|nr:MAG: beta-glucosidase [Planctomycetes bacterium GWF2_42_9]